jgi:hypothetical protein
MQDVCETHRQAAKQGAQAAKQGAHAWNNAQRRGVEARLHVEGELLQIVPAEDVTKKH